MLKNFVETSLGMKRRIFYKDFSTQKAPSGAFCEKGVKVYKKNLYRKSIGLIDGFLVVSENADIWLVSVVPGDLCFV